MTLPRPVLAIVVLCCCLSPCVAATTEQIEQAMEKAKNWLYTRQENGHWDNEESHKGQEGGMTAFVVYTLLALGEDPQDGRLSKAIDWMLKNESQGTYAISLRCQVWNLMPQSGPVRAAMKKDVEKLLFTIGPTRTAGVRGLYSYQFNNVSNADPSSSQYGALGMWAATQAGFEIPNAYWTQVDKQWRKMQDERGGWGYMGDPGDDGTTRASMTCAGVATLYIAQDQLNVGKGVQCKGNVTDPDIDRAMKWLTDHFDKAIRHSGYGLYSIERLGLASGRKYIGTRDWYQEIADRILKSQHENGSFPNQMPWIAETCFNTLFLVRGRAPLVMNKLEYSINGKPANWNQRPRDVANVVQWLSKQSERHFNWQITNLTGPVADLLDAPILYIAGNQPLKFTDEEMAKLKAYVEGGGIILGNADCAAENFSTSFKQLGTKLFPYEFRELPNDNVIYTGQMFPRNKWKTKPAVLGLSNGTRELMLLLPSLDASKAWYLHSSKVQDAPFALIANLFGYATEQKNPRLRPETHWITRDEKKKATSTIQVARLEYSGNWDPEPGGWRRLASYMHNKHSTALEVVPVKLGSGKLDQTFKIAHMTGTSDFSLNESAKNDLRNYIQGGGTLIIDSAAGSPPFTESATKELDLILGNAAQQAKVLPTDHAIFGGAKLPITYRSYARKVLVGQSNAPRLRSIELNGRPAVFLSSDDLSVGMVGHSVDGIIGYDPTTATELMARIIKYIQNPTGPASTTAPTTKQADTTE